MKRILALLLSCLLLCGCTGEPNAETNPTETVTHPTETQAAKVPGCYDPDSALEAQTGGAVRVFPLNIPDVYAMTVMGDSVVAFSATGTGTTLTKLSGDNLHTDASITLDFFLYPESGSFLSNEKGISFYDSYHMETVILDSSLREISRIPAPEDLQGEPILSADRKTMFYCTSDAVRAMEVSTGISTMLKEMSHTVQSVTASMMNDTVLQCSISDGEMEWYTLYISAENGETIHSTDSISTVITWEDRYYALNYDAVETTLLFGTSDQSPQALYPADLESDYRLLPEQNAAVTVSYPGDGLCRMCYYDLTSGQLLSNLSLSGGVHPWYIEAGSDGMVYILLYDEAYDCPTLYLWDPAALPSGDAAVYTGARQTPENPDTEGLVQCQAQADAISQRFGIHILVGFDAASVQPWDYELEAEYQTNIIRRELEQLEATLERYPEGFLKTLADCFDGLNICLVRSLNGTHESGSLDTADGIQFWDGQIAYVAIATGHTADRTVYHEMFHVIDSRVINECNAYDEWEKLNPAGFEYDYDYIANQNRDGSEYLTGENRAFIDTYSMSFPKEDRARIMEYAMTPGNEDFFRSETMQNKLRQLCVGIREAFGLEKSSEIFPWEQYLNTPLAK